MTKELLTIEFRYHDAPKSFYDCEYKTKIITIGIFDTLDEAIEGGNKVLSVLSKNFEVRADDKFKKNYLFGAPKRLVTNCCYPTKGVQYFAKITSLKFEDLNETIKETFDAFKRYKNQKS